MMLRLCSKITITNKSKEVFTLDSVKSVEATTSWDSLVDTAKVELPKNIFVRKDNTARMVSLAERSVVVKDTAGKKKGLSGQALFEVGDKIKIELGYDLNFKVVMEGMITDISPTVPIVLQCADPMWLLGKIKFDQEIRSNIDTAPPKLVDLLTAMQLKFVSSKEVIDLAKTHWPELTSMRFKRDDNKKTENFTLSNFSVKNKTLLMILEQLKKQFYLYSYYKTTDVLGKVTSRTISCGNYYQDNKETKLKKVKKFNFQNNIISEELVDKKEKNINVRVEATNIVRNEEASSTTVKVGSESDEAKTLYLEFHDLDKNKTRVKKILEDIAKRKLKTIRYTGYSGHFMTFGKPFVTHGDTIKLIDNYLEDRNGYFKVRQVDYSFGDTGFRQKVYLHSQDENPPIDITTDLS